MRNILILPQLAPVAENTRLPRGGYERRIKRTRARAATKDSVWPTMKRLKAIGIVSTTPPSNPDLLQERNLSRMAFPLIPVKEELISVREFIESLGTHMTLIFVLSLSLTIYTG